MAEAANCVSQDTKAIIYGVIDAITWCALLAYSIYDANRVGHSHSK